MVLSDGEIREALEKGNLIVSPPSGYEVLIKPSSIDLRLDPVIQVIRPDLIDPSETINPTSLGDVPRKTRECSEERLLYVDQPFILEPGVFVIASTAESVHLSDSLAGRIEGKSSLARFGVQVHLTAPKIDPGWPLNKITLEIINLAHFRVSLYPLMEIAALIVEPLGRPAEQSYQGRFSGRE